MACAKDQTYPIGTLTFSLLALALIAGCSDPVPGSGSWPRQLGEAMVRRSH